MLTGGKAEYMVTLLVGGHLWGWKTGVITVTGNDKVYSMILEVNGGGRVKYKITAEEFKNKDNNN